MISFYTQNQNMFIFIKNLINISYYNYKWNIIIENHCNIDIHFVARSNNILYFVLNCKYFSWKKKQNIIFWIILKINIFFYKINKMCYFS